MTRPRGARWSSPGTRSPSNTRSVASNTGVSRLDAVSSGPISRNVVGLRRITSRSQVPSTLVLSSWDRPGSATVTA